MKSQEFLGNVGVHMHSRHLHSWKDQDGRKRTQYVDALAPMVFT